MDSLCEAKTPIRWELRASNIMVSPLNKNINPVMELIAHKTKWVVCRQCWVVCRRWRVTYRECQVIHTECRVVTDRWSQWLWVTHMVTCSNEWVWVPPTKKAVTRVESTLCRWKSATYIIRKCSQLVMVQTTKNVTPLKESRPPRSWVVHIMGNHLDQMLPRINTIHPNPITPMHPEEMIRSLRIQLNHIPYKCNGKRRRVHRGTQINIVSMPHKVLRSNTLIAPRETM